MADFQGRAVKHPGSILKLSFLFGVVVRRSGTMDVLVKGRLVG